MNAMYSVHPVGLNDEARKILTVTLNVLTACGCGVRFADEVSGETLVIVDVDTLEGRTFYEQNSEKHRAVVISGDDRKYRAGTMLRKPLRVQALRNLLSDIFESGEENGVMSNNDVIEESSVVERLPNTTLFNAMVNAVSANVYYRITAADSDAPILLHGPSRHLYTRLSPEQISSLAGLKGSAIKVTVVNEMAFMKEARGMESYRYERFLWLAETKGSEAARAAVTGAFHLKEWPRFDINMVKPEFLSLSAIMTRKTLGCSALARVSGVPLETVYEFYYAAKACGVVQEKVVNPVVEESGLVEPAKKGSLVSRIARKLGLSLV